ncbi:MAG: hypothetical protein FWC89_09450 [Defluviitaleaceae bacterium]|nr:hypothetical protein [Defluviitaleaceae bacterium]
MYITWEDAKQQFKNKWVVIKNPEYEDIFHMHLIGGEFVGIADTQSEMFNLIPDTSDDDTYTGRHTEEENAVGVLMFGY